MAKNATPDAPLKILAYTPAIGFLAQPINDWNRLRNALDQKPNGRPIVEVVCLRERDLSIWHKLFIGRTTLRGVVTSNMTDDATIAANTLLSHISQDGVGKPIQGTVHRLPWRFMPGFYLFIIRERAIIVTPLFMPFPKGAPKQKQESLPTVQMIGVETQDRAIIRDVESIFNYYKMLPQNPLGEAQAPISCQVLKTWIDKAANADVTMASLRDALLSCHGFASNINEHVASDPNCVASLELDVHIKTW
jgi:hypothetical protein